jgi:hypothetical protein
MKRQISKIPAISVDICFCLNGPFDFTLDSYGHVTDTGPKARFIAGLPVYKQAWNSSKLAELSSPAAFTKDPDEAFNYPDKHVFIDVSFKINKISVRLPDV